MLGVRRLGHVLILSISLVNQRHVNFVRLSNTSGTIAMARVSSRALQLTGLVSRRSVAGRGSVAHGGAVDLLGRVHIVLDCHLLQPFQIDNLIQAVALRDKPEPLKHLRRPGVLKLRLGSGIKGLLEDGRLLVGWLSHMAVSWVSDMLLVDWLSNMLLVDWLSDMLLVSWPDSVLVCGLKDLLIRRLRNLLRRGLGNARVSKLGRVLHSMLRNHLRGMLLPSVPLAGVLLREVLTTVGRSKVLLLFRRLLATVPLCEVLLPAAPLCSILLLCVQGALALLPLLHPLPSPLPRLLDGLVLRRVLGFPGCNVAHKLCGVLKALAGSLLSLSLSARPRDPAVLLSTKVNRVLAVVVVAGLVALARRLRLPRVLLPG